MLAWALVLAQAAASGPSLDRLATAFVEGDVSARVELLRAGPYAVLPLRKACPAGLVRVDELLFEIKVEVAGEEGVRMARLLREKKSLELARTSLRDACFELRSENWPVICDPALTAVELEKPVSLLARGLPGWQVLDGICRETGLDYGFHYGRAVLAKPGRLWPEGPPPRPVPLAKDDEERAKKWIEQLHSDAPEDREQAFGNLLRMGSLAVPLLEKSMEGNDAETASRCRDLVARARRLSTDAIFRPPAAERQGLSGKDAEFRRLLQEKRQSFKVTEVRLLTCLKLLNGLSTVDVEAPGDLGEGVVTVNYCDEPLWTVLGVTCRAAGCDFIIRDRKVIVGRSGEIEKRLSEK